MIVNIPYQHIHVYVLCTYFNVGHVLIVTISGDIRFNVYLSLNSKYLIASHTCTYYQSDC